MEFNLEGILSVLSVVITSWFTYNQYTKNKMTDYKIEKFKKEEDEKYHKRAENGAKVFGQIWKILYNLGADRVYIVQPHPLGHPAYYTIQFEVKDDGVDGVADQIQFMSMGDVPLFSTQMAENLYLYIEDIDKGIEDVMAKSIFLSNGCKGVIIKRLNSHTDWNGSIICEFMDSIPIDSDKAREVLHKAAISIQYILPPVIEKEKKKREA